MSTEDNLITHWIGGKPATGLSARTAPVYNPATGAVAGDVEGERRVLELERAEHRRGPVDPQDPFHVGEVA